MNNFLFPILATLVISLVSFVGIITLALREAWLKKTLFILIGLSAGTLMGGAILHLIPETLESNMGETALLFIIVGFLLFFVLERLIHWHHCHDGHCPVHTFTYMSLFGDGFHNFIDGLIIAASFAVNVQLGIATSMAVLLHEIPQEISDFGVLLYGGFSKGKALLFNFITALMAVVGALVGIVLVSHIDNIVPVLLAITAGGFIYVAAADLVPELHKENKKYKTLLSISAFVIGVAIMYLLKMSLE